MDKTFKNEGFSNIKIKYSIAKKFRSFALKNIEKTQTKPTLGMLQALFMTKEKKVALKVYREKEKPKDIGGGAKVFGKFQ
jgi:hypothetical protein